MIKKLKKKDVLPAAQDIHHRASQLWVKNEKEERVDKRVDERNMDCHLVRRKKFKNQNLTN